MVAVWWINPFAVIWRFVCYVVNEHLKKQNEGLTSQNDELRDVERSLSGDIERLEGELEAARHENQQVRSELEDREAQIFRFRTRVSSITDGLVWRTSPHGSSVPTFREQRLGVAPIVAIATLKGGVGKTTLTANLAATYWSEGKSVLLVDLDYQGSLTLLTLTDNQRSKLNESKHYVDQLVSLNPPGNIVAQLAKAIGDSTGDVIAADESFQDFEVRSIVDWISDGTVDDIRFRLRRVLHADTVQSKYDVILLDCPPRLTVGCINALAACDFVLIPVIPDALSAESVPRLLKHLTYLKNAEVCPDLSILGVVANKMESKGDWPDKIWKRVGQACQDVWEHPIPLLDPTIPRRVAFPKASDDPNVMKRFPSIGEMKERFASLRTKIDQIILDKLTNAS